MKRTLILGSALIILLVVAIIWIIVSGSNNPPVAENITITTEEDTPVSIDLVGSDPDGDMLSFIVQSKPSHGSLSGTEPNLIYAPEKNFNGPDSLTFKISDGSLESAEATVSVSVTAINDPPAAVDDEISTVEDTPIVVIDVLANDTDVDNDRLIILGVTQGKNGSVTINTNNMLTYTAKKNFCGGDSFGYTVSDGKGGTDTATVELTVTATNDPPVITSKPVKTTRVWGTYSYDVDAEDPDAGDKLTFSLIEKPYGMEIDSETGLIEWKPNNTQAGDHNVTVKVEDANNVPASATQSFSVTVASLSSPLTTEMTVQNGYNHRSGEKLSSQEKAAVAEAGDDNFCEIDAGSSVSFDFSDAEIPEGARIVSVTVFLEHFEDRQFPAGKLQWNIGRNWPKNPDVWASIDPPVRAGQSNKTMDSWDITSIVDTSEKIDSLQLNIKNNNNIAMRRVFVDYIRIMVRWY
ncbi:MAG: tandem-95 repeat protein [Sedimentisphaerales bacterium]|nr:tandem-95 repeat protein [Sedimentisphaerales bacterium]